MRNIVLMNFLLSAFFLKLEPTLIHFLHRQIFLAPLLLFIEEAGVPLPIPGDIVIAFIGYRITRGAISYGLAFGLILAAVLAGSTILYFLAKLWGQLIVVKLGKYFHLSEKSLKLVEDEFRKYGVWVIIFGRNIPIFRVPITFFAGMSGVKYSTFIGSTFISVIFWVAFYLYLGSRIGPMVIRTLLGHFRYLPLITIGLIILLILFLWRKTKR